MKALSVRHPWAWAIIAGYKRVENRSWRTTHRGPLAIHAAKSRSFLTAVSSEVLQRDYPELLRMPHPSRLVYGAVIGVVNLVGCVRHADLPADLRDHRYADASPDNWCWILSDPRPLAEPIAAKGNVSLFVVDLPAESLEQRA